MSVDEDLSCAVVRLISSHTRKVDPVRGARGEFLCSLHVTSMISGASQEVIQDDQDMCM